MECQPQNPEFRFNPENFHPNWRTGLPQKFIGLHGQIRKATIRTVINTLTIQHLKLLDINAAVKGLILGFMCYFYEFFMHTKRKNVHIHHSDKA